MKCISPLSIRDPKGLTPSGFITVPCGKCASCLINRRNEWIVRLTEEARHCPASFFLTLTYNDDNIPLTESGLPTVRRADVLLFIRRIRRRLGSRSLRYYLVSEYGPKTFRPHYHGLFFLYTDVVLSVDLFRIFEEAWCDSSEGSSLGFISATPCNPARIGYCASFHVGKGSLPDFGDVDYPPDECFCIMSRRPGLGSSYLDNPPSSFFQDVSTVGYTFNGGAKGRLPRTWKDKLLSPVQKKLYAEYWSSKAEFEYDPMFPDKVIDQKRRVSKRLSKHKRSNL